MTKDPYEPLVGSVDALAKYVMWAVAVALPALLSEVFEVHSAAAAAKGIECRLEIAPDLDRGRVLGQSLAQDTEQGTLEVGPGLATKRSAALPSSSQLAKRSVRMPQAWHRRRRRESCSRPAGRR